MPFGVVSGVGQGTSVLDGEEIVEWGRGNFVGEFGVSRCTVVTNGILCVRGGDALFPSDLGETCSYTC